MPIPLIPVIAALAAGGSIVPHAAGGFIVSSAATGYIAGTYLGTAAIASILTGATATLGVGVVAVSGLASAAIGSAGFFGTTIGASGLTGLLMSAGIVSATPVAVPIAIGGAAIGGTYLAYFLFRLRHKVYSTPAGQEAKFTDKEAKVVEALIRLLAKKSPPV